MTRSLIDNLNSLVSEAFQWAPIAILACDEDGQIIVANEQAISIAAMTGRFESGSLSPPIVGMEFSHVFGVPMPLTVEGVSQKAHCLKTTDTEFALNLKRIRVNESSISLIYIEKVSESSHRQMMLEKEASTDELTGLANRRGFQRTMESNQDDPLSLAIIDIDQFKSVNDHFGHLAGDDTLTFVAEHLQNAFQDRAIVLSRMGGDEFSVLFKSNDSASIIRWLDEFRNSVAASFVDAGKKISVTVSIGAALSNASVHSSRLLLTEADKCLYQAKESGRNRLCHQLLDRGSETV